jgi:hypothetical protein
MAASGVLKTKNVVSGVFSANNPHHLDAVSAVFTGLTEIGRFYYMMVWVDLCVLKKQCAKSMNPLLL